VTDRNQGRAGSRAPAARAGALSPGRTLADAGPALRLLLVSWMAAEIERRRLFLWLPGFFGGGVLLYFAATREPALWAPLVGVGLFGAAALAARRAARPVAFAICLAIAFLFAGFAAACLRAISVSAPVLTRVSTAKVTGYIETVDARGGGGRALIRVLSIEGFEPAATPARIRVTARPRAPRSRADTILPAKPISPGSGRSAAFQGRSCPFRTIRASASRRACAPSSTPDAMR